MQPQIDTAKLKTIAIGPIIQRDLGSARRQSGHHLYWLCPFHPDHSPSLDVDTNKNRVFCNICSFSLDPVGWVMKYRHLGFVEAAKELDAVEEQPVSVVPLAPKLPAASLSTAWVASAETIVELGERCLWSGAEASSRVLAYLERRGLQVETLRRWEVGYIPQARTLDGVFVNPGILLPCRMEGQLTYITIRLLPGHPVKCSKCGLTAALTADNRCPACQAKLKYRSVPGGVPGLWGADACRGRRVVFGCEGEFDAMLTWQEAGSLGGVFTRTNGAGKQWRDEWSLYLLDADAILLLLDNDAAGEAGKLKLALLGERMVAEAVPGGYKDLTEYALHGGSLFQWLQLAKYTALMQPFADAAEQATLLRGRLDSDLPASLAADYKTDLMELGAFYD